MRVSQAPFVQTIAMSKSHAANFPSVGLLGKITRDKGKQPI